MEKTKYIGIYYGDESGFTETPYVPYGWQVKGENLSIPTQKGRRWNVFGIMDKFGNLFADKTLKSIDSEFVINCINSFSNNPAREPRSIIILDNAKIHHSNQFQANIDRWKKEGIEIFYLPTYSPELNLIEILWKKIKYEWFVPKDYESWGKITDKLNDIITNFGVKYKINFKF